MLQKSIIIVITLVLLPLIGLCQSEIVTQKGDTLVVQIDSVTKENIYYQFRWEKDQKLGGRIISLDEVDYFRYKREGIYDTPTERWRMLQVGLTGGYGYKLWQVKGTHLPDHERNFYQRFKSGWHAKGELISFFSSQAGLGGWFKTSRTTSEYSFPINSQNGGSGSIDYEISSRLNYYGPVFAYRSILADEKVFFTTKFSMGYFNVLYTVDPEENLSSTFNSVEYQHDDIAFAGSFSWEFLVSRHVAIAAEFGFIAGKISEDNDTSNALVPNQDNDQQQNGNDGTNNNDQIQIIYPRDNFPNDITRIQGSVGVKFYMMK